MQFLFYPLEVAVFLLCFHGAPPVFTRRVLVCAFGVISGRESPTLQIVNDWDGKLCSVNNQYLFSLVGLWG